MFILIKCNDTENILAHLNSSVPVAELYKALG